MAITQKKIGCEGCRRGLYLSDDLIHWIEKRGEKEPSYRPYIACSQYLYEPRPSRVQLVLRAAKAVAVEAGVDLDANPLGYEPFLPLVVDAYDAIALALPKGTLPT